MSHSLKNLRGIVPPLITPLIDRDQLDIPGMKRLVEHVLGGGVHGLFILGTTGEAPSLSYHLRRQWIDNVCELVSGRVPVLVGITDTSFVESVALAKHATKAGADAVVLSTPYYFPAGQTELAAYIDHIVDELPLPLVLYNMPSLTKVWFDVETVEKLSCHKNIVGVKDSSGDLEYFKSITELKRLRPDWFVMIGPEAMLGKAMRAGGDGGVSGGANLAPRLFVDYYHALASDDSGQAELLSTRIERLQAIYDVGKYASRHIKATKCGLSLMGICDDFMAEPFNRFLPPERERVADILKDIVPL
ncbi:MAG TPA: dihydrodipicolinate synthase family protein [Planctomycetaceae bacterium]|nr:dihydrodipicolinate synthase family protein [Planctomycetaceae bacterium]